MEGSGPYRIYDPGGSAEASAAYERLVEENSRLKEKMQGMKTLGKGPVRCVAGAPWGTDLVASSTVPSLHPAVPSSLWVQTWCLC